jgi:stage II sporulation protein D
VLALVVVRSGGDGDADRRSAWRGWAREKSWQELAERVELPDLESLEVTARAPSGRVVGLAAVGRGGERRSWSGFPVRRAIDLPENLFTFEVRTRSDGTRVVRFLGRAWGHGIGLCQNGAYGLARAGLGFAEILSTYYQGIALERWQPVATTAAP